MSAFASPITSDDYNNSDIGSDADAIESSKSEDEGVEIKEDDEPEEEGLEEEKVELKGMVSDCPVDTYKNHTDLCSPVGQEGNLISVSPAVGNLEVRRPSYLPFLEGNEAMFKVSVPSCKVPTIKKDDFQLKYKLTISPKSRKNLDLEDDKNQGLEVGVENAGSLLQCKAFGGYCGPSCNYTSYFSGVEDLSSGTSKSFTDTGKDGAIDLQRDCFVEDASGVQNSMKQIRQLEMHSGDAMRQMTSRNPTLDSRTRTLSPCPEIKVESKRPAIVCTFFSKGWCIRGNSCSFLHIKDPPSKSGQQAEGELVSQDWKREVQPEEGIGDDVKRSRMSCSPVPLAAPLERKSLYSSEYSLNPIIQKEVSPSWHPDKSQPVSTFPSYPAHAEGMATTQHLDMHYGFTSQVESRSPNLGLDTHLPTTCMSLSHHIHAQSGCSLPFSSSLGESTVDSQQFLSSGMEYHASRSTFSGSEREGLPLSSSFGVPSHPHLIGCKSKTSSYDWEPSIPFKPSFFITSSSVSSVGDQYDPFRGSVEIPNIGDGSLKAFILSHRSSIQASSRVPTNVESAEAANRGSDLLDAKSSVSSHNRTNKNEPEKSVVAHGSLTTETKRTAGNYLKYQFGRLDVGQNTFGCDDVKNREKEQTEHDARPQVEVSEYNKQRVDRYNKNNEMDVYFQKDGCMQKESNMLRNFRFALVDHVKELLKPLWHEGHLSKDAHIMIVKRSVDKIISTIHPKQMPPNEDSIKKYLSFCQVKIANLVNEYTSIYGKV